MIPVYSKAFVLEKNSIRSNLVFTVKMQFLYVQHNDFQSVTVCKFNITIVFYTNAFL